MQNFYISLVLFILYFFVVYSEYVVVISILDRGLQVY